MKIPAGTHTFMMTSVGDFILIGVALVLGAISIVLGFLAARKLMSLKNIPGRREIYIGILGTIFSNLFLIPLAIFIDERSIATFETVSDVLEKKTIDLLWIMTVVSGVFILCGVYGFFKLVTYLKTIEKKS